jgi:GntR family transcriptional repressor for pyruvate dehydrogenase complex
VAFTPVPHRRLSGEIFRQVVGSLVRGELKSGERLPPESELALRLGVSRTGVREALRMLEQAGLVTIKRGPRGGAFVRETSQSSITQSLALMYQLDHLSRSELTEARHFLEATTARLASERATEEDLEALRQALRISDDDPMSPQAFIRSNNAFHTAVARAAHNRVLLIMLASVQALIDRALAESRLDTLIIARAASDHRRIYEAIAKRQPNRAEAAILEHIESFEHEFRDMYLSDQISYWPIEPDAG